MCVETEYVFEEKAVDYGRLCFRVSVSTCATTAAALHGSDEIQGLSDVGYAHLLHLAVRRIFG